MAAIIFQKPREIIGATNLPAAGTKLILPMGHNGRCDKVTPTSGFTAGGVDGGDIHFVPIPCEDASRISLEWRWFDATTSVSAVEVQFSNVDSRFASDYDDSDHWICDCSINVVGPSGIGADSEGINIANVGWRRARLRFVADANGDVSFWSWGKD